MPGMWRRTRAGVHNHRWPPLRGMPRR